MCACRSTTTVPALRNRSASGSSRRSSRPRAAARAWAWRWCRRSSSRTTAASRFSARPGRRQPSSGVVSYCPPGPKPRFVKSSPPEGSFVSQELPFFPGAERETDDRPKLQGLADVERGLQLPGAHHAVEVRVRSAKRRVLACRGGGGRYAACRASNALAALFGIAVKMSRLQKRDVCRGAGGAENGAVERRASHAVADNISFRRPLTGHVDYLIRTATSSVAAPSFPTTPPISGVGHVEAWQPTRITPSWFRCS